MRPLSLLPIVVLALAPQALAQDSTGGAPVVVHDRTFFEVAAGSGSITARQRADAAAAILTELVDRSADAVALPVEVQPLPEASGFSLSLSGREIFRVGAEDAGGLAADVYAQALASKIEAAVARERRRVVLQQLLESVSLTVLFGMLAFLALRRVAASGERSRAAVEKRLVRLQGLHLRNFELVSSETLQGASYVLLGVGRVALQLGIAYAYLVFALSQFSATRGWVAPLSRGVTAPFLTLLERVGGLVPGLILALAALFLLRGLLRLSGFLLDRVAAGEFQWQWLPKDLAPAARPLIQVGLILAAVVAAGPLLGGGSDGIAARLGQWALAAIALGAVPVLAAAALGSFALFGRRYRLGEWVAIGPHVGEVTHVGFLEVTLVPQSAGRVRVPHLVTLWTPVQHLPNPAAPPPESSSGA